MLPIEATNYLEKLRLGEEEGLRFFMKKMGKPLRYFAFKITRDKELSEEIVSEAFFKLWQGREKVVSEESLKAFLYLVTRNACYDFVGSAYKKHRSALEEMEVLLNAEIQNTDILAQIIYTEFIEQVVLELEKLPKQQAQIFRMSFMEGKDTDEICRELNTTSGNVYFARSKALSALRSRFKEKDFSFYLFFMLLILYP